MPYLGAQRTRASPDVMGKSASDDPAKNARRRNVAERFGEVTRELTAMGGLPDEVAQRDAIAMQMV